MTVLRPDQFEQVVAQARRGIDHRLDTLVTDYRLAHGAAYDRVVRENGGRVNSGGHSDPTASITGDPLDAQRPGIQAAIRKVLETVPSSLATTENGLSAITTKIERAMNRLDPAEGFVALRFPRTASQADLAESQAAQERRAHRGEGS